MTECQVIEEQLINRLGNRIRTAVFTRCVDVGIADCFAESLDFGIERDPRDNVTYYSIAKQMVAEILAPIDRESVEVKFFYPRTLWQHFKERCFPAWLRRRFPVLYRAEVRVVSARVLAIYPLYPRSAKPVLTVLEPLAVRTRSGTARVTWAIDQDLETDKEMPE